MTTKCGRFGLRSFREGFYAADQSLLGPGMFSAADIFFNKDGMYTSSAITRVRRAALHLISSSSVSQPQRLDRSREVMAQIDANVRLGRFHDRVSNGRESLEDAMGG